MIQKKCLLVFLLLIGGFSPSLQSKDVPKPNLMLAKIYHDGINLNEYWVSEKYDGVRAIWDGHQLISRGGNIYHAPRWFTANFPQQKLDGELWIKRQSFELVVSTVRDSVPDDIAWKEVKFMVFDLPEVDAIFDERLILMQKLISQSDIPWLRIVKQWKVSTHSKLMAELTKRSNAGAEGLMLHRGSSLYKGKRTGDLLKVKQYQDEEAIVIGHIAGKGKYKNHLGALLVRNQSGIQFKIGSGFTDLQRKNPPEIGETITYQYRGKTKNSVPRFATFLRVRKSEK